MTHQHSDGRAQSSMLARRIVAVIVCAGALVTTGCSDMAALGGSSKFGCKAPDGVHCMSVSGVYANAVQNNLPGQQSGRQTNDGSPPAVKSPAPRRASLSPAVYRLTPEGDAAIPLRSQARVLRLWIKPWEDDAGDLVDQGYLFVTVNDGRWLIENRDRTIREAYAVGARKPAVPSAAGGVPQSPAAQATHPSTQPAIPKETLGRLTDALKAAQAQQRRFLDTEGVERDGK